MVLETPHTSAPSSVSCLARPRPIPDPAPVTRYFRPWKSDSILWNDSHISLYINTGQSKQMTSLTTEVHHVSASDLAGQHSVCQLRQVRESNSSLLTFNIIVSLWAESILCHLRAVTVCPE